MESINRNYHRSAGHRGSCAPVFDPEIPVNIYELGLIYEVKVSAEGAVTIQMTLTSPHCPAVQSLPAEIESKVQSRVGSYAT